MSTPMTWSEQHGGHWIVTGHPECCALAGARAGVSSRPTVHIPPSALAERGVRIYALESDDPEHRDERAALRAAVGSDAAAAAEPAVRRIARALLSDLDWSAPVDLAAAYAYRLPLLVISEIVGVPKDEAPELRRHTNVLLFRGGTEAEALASADRITDIARSLIGRRRAEPRGDWLDELIGRSAEEDAVRAVVALITGGHHSTSRAIGSLIARTLTEPGLRDLLTADPGRIPAAAEETLRLHTPLPTFSRNTTADHDVGSVRVSAGQPVLLCYTDANRDPRVFVEPDRFDIDRPHHDHLAFGWGPHRCVGMYLARTELRIAMEELLASVPSVHLVEPVRWTGPAEPAALLVAS